MPTRDIKESCRTSRTLARISAGAERLFWRLTTYADDFGRFPADVAIIRAACFPVMLHAVRENHVAGWVMELRSVSLITLYETQDGKEYGFFPTWDRHQRTRAKHSKYPAPTSADICRHMPANVAVVTEVTEVTEDTEVVPKTPKKPTHDNTSPRAEEVWPSPEALVALYNAKAPDECAAVTKLSPGRLKKAREYLAAFPDRQFWEDTCGQIRASRFLRGLRPSSNGHEHFVADFDWLLSKGKDGSENCVKVYEGKYHG